MPEAPSPSGEGVGGGGVDQALRTAALRLAATSDTPRLDAELLMAHALGISRETLLLSDRRHLPHPIFAQLLDRRLGGEPVAYIVGTRDFWSITLAVGPGALIPRPDSETLIEAAVAHFGASGPRTILDLGTGPGTLLLAALAQWPDATGLGIDISEAALGFARANIESLGFGSRASVRAGNWAEGVTRRFDLILANPPYIEDKDPSLSKDITDHEPAEALFAGPDGLDAYKALARHFRQLIAPGGLAAIEIGATQREAVTALFSASDLTIECRRDLAGRDRAILLYPR